MILIFVFIVFSLFFTTVYQTNISTKQNEYVYIEDSLKTVACYVRTHGNIDISSQDELGISESFMKINIKIENQEENLMPIDAMACYVHKITSFMTPVSNKTIFTTNFLIYVNEIPMNDEMISYYSNFPKYINYKNAKDAAHEKTGYHSSYFKFIDAKILGYII